MENKLSRIYELLYRLGATQNYRGFYHAAYAVMLCTSQPDWLLLVTKTLYPEVAKYYKTNWKAVERNIRTVSDVIWRENRSLLEKLAHRSLHQKPQNAQFLSILAAAMNDPSPAARGLRTSATGKSSKY